jgi:5'-3' exonuclease
MRELFGKTIVIDVSIYLYKYSALIENIYLMISIFKNYGIIPIFIFDGKPPTEKKALLQKRRQDKVEAEKEYHELKTELNNPRNNLSKDDREEIATSLDLLKKQFIYIKKDQIKQVKELIVSYGCVYYDASGEADVLCAQLVISGKAWACMSEDMDMFVYGVPRVLRYFSLMNHSAVLYSTGQILTLLGVTQEELRTICSLVNNDYNVANEELDFYKAVDLYKKYRSTRQIVNIAFEEDNDVNCGFYNWLISQNKTSKPLEILLQNYEMFILPPLTDKESYEYNTEKEQMCDYSKLQKILTEDGFVFLYGETP